MTLLVRRLDDATRKAFIPLVAWMRLLQIPSIDAGNLLLLGLCLGNLRWRASARPSELDDVKKWILGNVVSLRSSIVDAYATVRKRPYDSRFLAGIDLLFYNVYELDRVTARSLVKQTERSFRRCLAKCESDDPNSLKLKTTLERIRANEEISPDTP
jgi:hypothetical protein